MLEKKILVFDNDDDKSVLFYNNYFEASNPLASDNYLSDNIL